MPGSGMYYLAIASNTSFASSWFLLHRQWTDAIPLSIHSLIWGFFFWKTLEYLPIFTSLFFFVISPAHTTAQAVDQCPLSAQRVPFGIHWERAPSDLYKLLLLRDFSCTHHSQRPNAPLSCPVTMPSLIGGPGHHWNTLEWPSPNSFYKYRYGYKWNQMKYGGWVLVKAPLYCPAVVSQNAVPYNLAEENILCSS